MIDTHIDRQTNRQTDKQKDRQTERQTNRQTGACIQVYAHTSRYHGFPVRSQTYCSCSFVVTVFVVVGAVVIAVVVIAVVVIAVVVVVVVVVAFAVIVGTLLSDLEDIFVIIVEIEVVQIIRLHGLEVNFVT